MPGSQEVLEFPVINQQEISPYLPPLKPKLEPLSEDTDAETLSHPFITLTYAASLDSCISLSLDKPTLLSGPESKAMTHFLRANHDGILIGCGTAICDNPTLNSRINEAVGLGLELQPRPIILDRHARWHVNKDSKVIKAAQDGRGKGPWILVDENNKGNISRERRELVERCGGEYIIKVTDRSWVKDLKRRGLRSIMIEGGRSVINDMLEVNSLVDSMIITMAPMFLGDGSVRVGLPKKKKRKRHVGKPALDLKDVKWMPMGRDVVLCGKTLE